MSPLIDKLIQALQRMPGVGPKSATRIAFQLLHRDRDGARRIADALLESVAKIGHCQRCNTFSEMSLCPLCTNPKRDGSLLCVVESPLDVYTVEESADYAGFYFVLMGHLSPLDGIGPSDIGLDKLLVRLQGGEVRELILATGTTLEGEATAHYIKEMTRGLDVRVSRIAFGVPLGGDLEYIDSTTLSHAIASRREI